MTKKDYFLYGLAGIIVIGYFIQFFVLVSYGTEYAEIVKMQSETMKNGVILVLGYFFGSSKGSADKTAIMANGNGKGVVS
jgi:hypothetical protein